MYEITPLRGGMFDGKRGHAVQGIVMSPDTPFTELLISEVANAIRRAYAEGHRIGLQDAADRMNRALSGVGESGAEKLHLTSPQVIHAAEVRTPLPDRGNGYGRLITAIRQAFLGLPDAGLTRDDLLDFCYRQGIEVNPNGFKDTMKRLVGGQEVIRRHQSYFRGPRLRLDLIPLNSRGMEQAVENTDAVEHDSGQEHSTASGEVNLD